MTDWHLTNVELKCMHHFYQNVAPSAYMIPILCVFSSRWKRDGWFIKQARLAQLLNFGKLRPSRCCWTWSSSDFSHQGQLWRIFRIIMQQPMEGHWFSNIRKKKSKWIPIQINYFRFFIIGSCWIHGWSFKGSFHLDLQKLKVRLMTKSLRDYSTQ